ncbi:MAG: hypothetical protein ACM3ZB_02110 [bacterium]|jgi:hypothetical protein
MACGYISSNDERFYAGLELVYGQVPEIQSANRFPAVKLRARQVLQRPKRRDKTGTRTYVGTPANLRRRTTFGLTTYMTAWTRQDAEPGYGALFQACLGRPPLIFEGGVAGENTNAKLLRFDREHGLEEGQAVTFGGELRFAISIVDGATVELNAPFSMLPGAGAPIGPTVTYMPARDIPTVSIFDYWSPAGAVNRIINGAAMERLRIKVNGDYHEFEFSGLAKDIIDSTSFVAGQGELSAFPPEPPLDWFDYTIIPGHLGQAWLGNTPDQFHTITAAELTLENDIDVRAAEFGSDSPECIAVGPRTVTLDFDLFELNDAATKSLYQAARQSSPIAAMFQLGQQAGQLFGVYMKSVVPEVPEFDDSETRLQWRFSDARAQGTGDDELVVAFG